MAAKLKAIKAQLQRRIHARIPGMVLWLQQVVRGYFQFHAVPATANAWLSSGPRWCACGIAHCEARSQRSRLRWATFGNRLAVLLPTAQILQPYPNLRFDAQISLNPR